MAEGKTLHQKMHSVMSAIGTIEKKGKNSFHGYNYATEADFVQAIRPLLVQEGILIIPMQVAQHTKEGEFTNIVLVYRLINVDDSKDYMDVQIPACGQDKGDKGVYKAITGAKKYMLANTFMIATGDDPEKDDKTSTKLVEKAGKQLQKRTKFDY